MMCWNINSYFTVSCTLEEPNQDIFAFVTQNVILEHL